MVYTQLIWFENQSVSCCCRLLKKINDNSIIPKPVAVNIFAIELESTPASITSFPNFLPSVAKFFNVSSFNILYGFLMKTNNANATKTIDDIINIDISFNFLANDKNPKENNVNKPIQEMIIVSKGSCLKNP